MLIAGVLANVVVLNHGTTEVEATVQVEVEIEATADSDKSDKGYK